MRMVAAWMEAGGCNGVASGAWHGRAMLAGSCALVASDAEGGTHASVIAGARTASVESALGALKTAPMALPCCCSSLGVVPPRSRLADLSSWTVC